MAKNASKPNRQRHGKWHMANGKWSHLPSAIVLLPCLLVLTFGSCRWRASYPADRIASSLRHMCSTDYKLSIEARHEQKDLQALVWKVGLFKGSSYELQSVNREALDAMDHVLLCATRIALSTDASLDFIEIKIADVLTGATVTLWRYVPDIRDSMYQRIGDTEYFNRLVIEISPGSNDLRDASSALRRLRHKGALSQDGAEVRLIPRSQDVQWDTPLSMSEFLAKQVILRARREGAESLEAHADLSEPATLGVVIDNWSAIEDEGPERAAKVRDVVHKSAEKVIRGYRFTGFHGLTLRDSRGAALNSWAL